MCSEIVQKDRFKTTTFRTTVSWLFERHSRVLLHIIMRSCKTLVIGIKHFSRSQVNYFGGIPVCLKGPSAASHAEDSFPGLRLSQPGTLENQTSSTSFSLFLLRQWCMMTCMFNPSLLPSMHTTDVVQQ